MGGQPAIHARDRIGNGPWYNHDGVMIAESLDQLHGENDLTKETQLSEQGNILNGRGDSPNRARRADRRTARRHAGFRERRYDVQQLDEQRRR